MYAIVRAGGRQEKVAVGDIVVMDRVAAEPGDSVQLPVLLVVSDGVVTSDAAALSQASVQAEVVGHERGPKIRILRYKNKTGYRRRQGHRQELTRVKVTTIESGSAPTKSTAKAEA
ncbi:MAG: 50S ribosomal protein L21 [bacterium]